MFDFSDLGRNSEDTWQLCLDESMKNEWSTTLRVRVGTYPVSDMLQGIYIINTYGTMYRSVYLLVEREILTKYLFEAGCFRKVHRNHIERDSQVLYRIDLCKKETHKTVVSSLDEDKYGRTQEWEVCNGWCWCQCRGIRWWVTTALLDLQLVASTGSKERRQHLDIFKETLINKPERALFLFPSKRPPKSWI